MNEPATHGGSLRSNLPTYRPIDKQVVKTYFMIRRGRRGSRGAFDPPTFSKIPKKIECIRSIFNILVFVKWFFEWKEKRQSALLFLPSRKCLAKIFIYWNLSIKVTLSLRVLIRQHVGKPLKMTITHTYFDLKIVK